VLPGLELKAAEAMHILASSAAQYPATQDPATQDPAALPLPLPLPLAVPPHKHCTHCTHCTHYWSYRYCPHQTTRTQELRRPLHALSPTALSNGSPDYTRTAVPTAAVRRLLQQRQCCAYSRPADAHARPCAPRGGASATAAGRRLPWWWRASLAARAGRRRSLTRRSSSRIT
jgi:hypothetical protein